MLGAPFIQQAKDLEPCVQWAVGVFPRAWQGQDPVTQAGASVPPTPQGQEPHTGCLQAPRRVRPQAGYKTARQLGAGAQPSPGAEGEAETFSSGDCLGEACGVGPTEVQGSCVSLTRKGGSEVSVQPGGQ